MDSLLLLIMYLYIIINICIFNERKSALVAFMPLHLSDRPHSIFMVSS